MKPSFKIRYYENGNKKQQIQTIGSKYKKLTRYWSDGTLGLSIEYYGRKRHGNWIICYRSGLLWRIVPYIYGSKEGWSHSWYDNGQKWTEAFYMDNKIVAGTEKWWYLNGEIWPRKS